MRRVLGFLFVTMLAAAGCETATRHVAVNASGASGGSAAAASSAAGAGRQTQSFSGVYPFTTRAELDAYAAGSDQTYRDPVRTARDFAVRYLGFTTPDLVDDGYQAGDPGGGEVPLGIRRNGQFLLATTVVVRQLAGQGATGPWAVIASSSPNIQVDTPDPLQRISSPVAVSGTASAFEGTVSIQVREDGMLAGQSLGTGFVTATSEGGPFGGQVTFRVPTKPGGAVVFQDRTGSGVGETDAHATSVVRVVYGPVDRTG